MITLLVAVFVASLVGSLHCAGMCGPFVAFATLHVKGKTAKPAGAYRLQLAYHGGRLLSYAALGAAAGVLGATLNLGSSMLGVGKLAGLSAGALLVVLGIGRILSLAGARVPVFPGVAWIARTVGAGQAVASGLSPLKRALLIGLLTTALPCGWLYAFVAAAAGTGQPVDGALVMLVFWAGTVPVLAGIGAGLGAALRRASKSIQIVTAVIVVGLGIKSIVGRWDLPTVQRLAPTSSIDAALERVSMMLGKGTHRCH